MIERKGEDLSRLVSEKMDVLGLTTAVFDLDDFICKTSRIFKEKMWEFAVFVQAVCPNVPYEKIWERLVLYNNAAYKRWSVNPDRWGEVIRLMAEDFGIQEEFLAAFGWPSFNRIYTTPLDFCPGAERTLEVFAGTGKTLGILSHGRRDWIEKKYQWLRLDRYLPLENVFAVDVNVFKGARHWLETADSLGVASSSMMIGDDNLASVRGAVEIGVKYAFWAPSEWTVYNGGEMPARVSILNSGIGEMPEAILTLD